MLRKSKMSIPWQMICVTALFFAVTSATAAEPEVTPVEFDGILPLRPRRLPPPECVPGMPIMPGIPGVPGTPGITPETPPNQMNPMLPQTADSGDSGGRGSALASGSLAFADPGGYLDNARPTTMFRVRYDAMFGFNQPDRSEFFWRPGAKSPFTRTAS